LQPDVLLAALIRQPLRQAVDQLLEPLQIALDDLKLLVILAQSGGRKIMSRMRSTSTDAPAAAANPVSSDIKFSLL